MNTMNNSIKFLKKVYPMSIRWNTSTYKEFYNSGTSLDNSSKQVIVQTSLDLDSLIKKDK